MLAGIRIKTVRGDDLTLFGRTTYNKENETYYCNGYSYPSEIVKEVIYSNSQQGRLTFKYPQGNTNYLKYNNDGICDYKYQQGIDRLAEYEDLGTVEELSALKVENERLRVEIIDRENAHIATHSDYKYWKDEEVSPQKAKELSRSEAERTYGGAKLAMERLMADEENQYPIKIGDMVCVKDTLKTYSTYYDDQKEKPKYYTSGYLPTNGMIVRVMDVRPNRLQKEDIVVDCRSDIRAIDFAIRIDGIVKLQAQPKM